MYNSINMSSIFVLDQDKAIDFYVKTLGMELTNDMDLGFMRWVTVGVPGQPGRDVLLELPGPPAMDEKTATSVRELVTKGATGFTLGLTTDDCKKTYETLKARGVEFTSEPEGALLRHRLRTARPIRQQHSRRAARGRRQRAAQDAQCAESREGIEI